MPLNFHDAMLDERKFRLRAALLIYHGNGGALVTGHDVMSEPGEWKPKLTAGYPLTRELMDLLVRGVQGAAPTRTVLPPNVLMWDGLRIAWWVPSARRRIWFNPLAQKGLQHVSRREVMHPPLVFVADPQRLHVFALAEDERPYAGTALYQAPYLNVYFDGWCCGGVVQWPKTVAVESLPEWEKAFFDSEGTKVWASRLTLFPGGHNALWEAMLTADRFPAEALVPTGRTLLDAINRAGMPEGIADPPPAEEIVPVGAALPCWQSTPGTFLPEVVR
jgi:PRTRC genetic system protein B